MADEWKEYVNDPRTVCKYATKCYQKNPEHHQKYKHPPQSTRKDVHRNKRRFSPYTRDSPRHSPNARKDESPSGNSKDKAGNDDRADEEKSANNNSDDDKKSEDPEIPKPDSNDDKKSEDLEVPKHDGSDDKKFEGFEVSKHDSSDDKKFEGFEVSKHDSSDDKKFEGFEVSKHDSSDDKKFEGFEVSKHDSSDDKKFEGFEVSKHDSSDDSKAVELPEKLTFYDKSTNNSLIKELFLVEMPEDFFKFFECITECGKSVEDTLASVNLMPIGPYDLLLGKLPILDNKELYLTHWRFFYDPPEFQAVIKKKKNSEYHIGYFRDEPDQKPVFVANNDSEKGYHITPMATNIFGAVYAYLGNEKKRSPFTAMSCQKLMNNIKSYAEKNSISLEDFNMKKRLAHMVTRSFHGAGIVVPYNKKTQLGYRHLVETDANLKKLFASLEKATSKNEKSKLLSDLQPVITYASIALDECDFGTGLEVGIALFCSGLKELEPSAMNCLIAAYSVLNRTSFGEIIKAHLKHRRKGPNVSLLHLK